MAEKKMNYPEGSVPASLHWLHVGRRVTSELADSWFEEFKIQSVRETLTEEELAYEKPAEIALDTSLVVGNDYKLAPQLEFDLEGKGYELVPILQSDLGKRIIDLLNQNNLVYEFESKLLIDDFQFVEIEEINAYRLNMPWETYFGDPFNQQLSIYRSATGEEYCYWHTALLCASRPLLERKYYEILTDIEDPASLVGIKISTEEIERGALTFEDWSRKIHLPWLAKCLFFLGETPLPSSFFNMPRTLAYPGLDQTEIPIPHIAFEKKVQLMTLGVRSIGGESRRLGLPILAPEQFQMGWLFSDNVDEKMTQMISTMSNALVRITSYVQDGFINHNSPNEAFNFDGVVFSGNQMERRFADSGRQGGYYRWLPTVELYELLQQTNSLWEEVDEPGKSQSDKNSIYAWIGDEGVGNAAVAACLNDGIFFSMIPAEAWGGVDFYAPIAFALNVKDQSTNAMSNWGVAYFLQGNFELAKVAFEIALDRDDKFADDEASFYLSKIYEQEGDLLKSEEYRKRCEAAGGYEPTYI